MKLQTSFQTTFTLGAIFLLGGCAIQHSANQNLTLAATGNVISATETAQRYHIQPNWWEGYQDGQLNALIQQAFERNIDLKKAAIRINKALYQANILGADLVPDFNASLGAANNKNLDTGNSNTSYSSQLGLSYELDLWHRLNARADAQVWEYQATAQDMAATRLTLANNIADAYFNIAYLNETIKLTQKIIRQYQEISRIMSAKYRYGKVDSASPRQAEQSLLAAQSSLTQLATQKETAEEVLRNLLNLKPGESPAADPADFHLHDVIGVDLNVPVAALANRPDLRAAEYRLQSALKNVDAQKRSYYPSITIGASLSTASDTAGTLFDVPFLGSSVRINLPFLDWKTLKWTNKNAEADFQAANLDFEQAVTTALNEVAVNYQKYRNALQTYADSQQQYALRQKNSRYYQIRYENGKNELRVWLEALNDEYGAARDLLNRHYESLQYENMIYKAMAGRYSTGNSVSNTMAK